MFRESFLFVGAGIVDAFDIKCFTNFKEVLTYLHLLKQNMLVSGKLFQWVSV